MQYTNRLGIHRGLIFITSLFLSIDLISQPAGLIVAGESDTVFSDRMLVIVEPQAIEIQARLSVSASSEREARAVHAQTMDELSSKLLNVGATFSQEEEVDIDRQVGFLRLRTTGQQAQSEFSLSATTGKQLAETMDILNATRDAEILGYRIIFPETESDEELTTELAKKLLADMRDQDKKSGTQHTPKGFSLLKVDSKEIGRNELEALLDGKQIHNWEPSDNSIQLIVIEKTVSVALVAS